MNQPDSPYLVLNRNAWGQYRDDTPLTLSAEELSELSGFNEALSVEEVEDIYLPLSRLLNLYVSQTQALHSITNQFLHHKAGKVPYIIGVSGSVAVGKSTTSRILQTLLSRWPNHPKVALVSTDGFLYTNSELEARGLIDRKGFPESYDRSRLIDFLKAIKSGQPTVSVPIYSHEIYNVTGETYSIEAPDILIIEGLNILQLPEASAQEQIYVSDFIDFSIFVDAPTNIIAQWYLERFQAFREQAINRPDLFFYQFAEMPEDEAVMFASDVWKSINEPNLNENILPFKFRADLILEKGADHQVERVRLRRL